MKFDEDELQKWETEYKKGFSKPLVLFALAEKSTYPYQVTKTISGKTHGMITVAGSNIYPILKKLEEIELISSEKDPSEKRIYSLTEGGKDFLVALKQSLKEFLNLIQEVIDTHDEMK
ncbi:MAG: PadR family transcriptional regulator [Candidatus Hodarchaeota archaeon]